MASKSNGLETDWARVPPPSGSVWEQISKAIYNPEEKSFLGRTPKRWGIAITFYLVFYAVLAVMFAICMAGLFHNLDYEKPYFTLENSLIGANPGVDFRPRPVDGVTVRYDISNSSNTQAYIQEIESFLKPYKDEPWFSSKTECVAADDYGYPNSPCFYIKLNKIYGWKPDFFDAADLPADMSEDTATFITNLPEKDRQQVWISCWAENANPNSTKIEYPWGRGLPSRFYPYLNNRAYLSPLVAVKITPPSTQGADGSVHIDSTPVVFRCRAWAKNIVYNKSIKEASGYARIILEIVDHTYTAKDTTS